MASADQLKALLKSHIDGDDGHFYAVAMQMAAHEAKLGHGKLAEELRAMIDDAKARSVPASSGKRPTPISQPRGELAGLLDASYPQARLSEMVRRIRRHLEPRRFRQVCKSPAYSYFYPLPRRFLCKPLTLS